MPEPVPPPTRVKMEFTTGQRKPGGKNDDSITEFVPVLRVDTNPGGNSPESNFPIFKHPSRPHGHLLPDPNADPERADSHGDTHCPGVACPVHLDEATLDAIGYESDVKEATTE